MTRAAWVRRIALASMALVTAWSLWAWAQPSTYEQQVKSARQEREESKPPAPMNWTQFGEEAPPFIAMLVNFGIMGAGYYLLAKRPIAVALQNRRDTIAKSIDEARRMKEEAEERAKTYQAKLLRLEEDARAAREALLRVGEAERQRIVAEAEAKAERVRRDTEFALEQELKQLRIDLWKAAVDAAVAAATEILKQKVTLADQERLAEGYLAELGAPESPPVTRVQEMAP
jgi:F-type H+-transporting ATPase subunit b